MATTKNKWVTVFEDALFGTSGGYCRIQKRGNHFRVTSGSRNWSYHDTADAACETCSQYCAQYNDKKNLLNACPFETLGIRK